MDFKTYILNLDNSFISQVTTTDGKIDFTIGLLCTLLAFFISQFLIKRYLQSKFNLKDQSSTNFMYYLLQRSTFPLTAIFLYILNYLRFIITTDKVSIIYPALIWLACWMLIIRIITGLVIFVIPKGAIRYALSNILSLFLWLAYILWWTDLIKPIINVLSASKIKIGPIHFTALSMIHAIISALIIISISLWLNRLVEKKINQTKRIDSTFKHVILRISKAIIFLVVILSVMPVLGVDLTTLSVFSGALGVGIGIGLKNFFGNVFSGVIILMDRSVKIGDRLVIGEHTGYVTKITSRHIVLQSLDNSEILVPNERFVFDTIVNQSYTDTTLLIKLKISVAYGSDLELALKLLVDSAIGHPALDPARQPLAAIDNFGAYAIELHLLIWIKDPRVSMIQPKTDIYLNIVKLFNEHNIEIPVPQQDLRIKEINSAKL